jgi:hypothetical protein
MTDGHLSWTDDLLSLTAPKGRHLLAPNRNIGASQLATATDKKCEVNLASCQTGLCQTSLVFQNRKVSCIFVQIHFIPP